MPEVVTSAKIWQCWEVAVARLLSNDRHLLEIDASERAISHRLGMYLANEFNRWDVDCEYNRMGRDIRKKCLNTYKELLQAEGLQLKVQEQRARIFPDIIVHRRGIEANLLAVEIKKSSNKIDRRYDLLKLKSLRQEMGYQYAVFLDIGVKNRSGIIVREERFQ
jgi:hypothetical protein